MSATALTTPLMGLKSLEKMTEKLPTSETAPALFLAHGHPINAIKDTRFTQTLTQIGRSVERPKAIMVVSAHWETRGTYVMTTPAPQTVYDFGRFDDRLFNIRYDAPGSPEMAREVIKLKPEIKEDNSMGFDHGTWTVLKFLYPDADIPVFQLSIDRTQGPEYHFNLATQLRELRKKGIMVVGSGNVVHNLRQLDWRNPHAAPHAWALEFDSQVKTRLDKKDFKDLIHYKNLGTAAMMSIPTNEHYLPMLYVIGMLNPGENITQFYEAFEYAGLSMRCFKVS